MPRCEKCQRDFATEEGFRQHMSDKHSEGMSRHELRQEKKKQHEEEKTRGQSKIKSTKMMRYAGIFAVIIIAAAGIGYFLMNQPANNKIVTGAATAGYFEGNESAKVTIVEFSDFQCPFCGVFARDTLPQIQQEYIETGKVKFIYKNFPLTQAHPQSQKAAEAFLAAAEQGKGFEMHDMMFANQEQLFTPVLKGYAKQLGLNETLFNSRLDSGYFASEIKKEYDEGVRLGVTGTPTFFINGRRLSGAQPFSEFKKIIDSELAKGAA